MSFGKSQIIAACVSSRGSYSIIPCTMSIPSVKPRNPRAMMAIGSSAVDQLYFQYICIHINI